MEYNNFLSEIIQKGYYVLVRYDYATVWQHLAVSRRPSEHDEFAGLNKLVNVGCDIIS